MQEEIFENDIRLDKSDLYSSDKRFGGTAKFSIHYSPESEVIFGMRNADGQLFEISKQLIKKKNFTETSKKLHISLNRIRKFFGIFNKIHEEEYGIQYLCECGQPYNHNGWCFYRQQHSEYKKMFDERAWTLRTCALCGKIDVATYFYKNTNFCKSCNAIKIWMETGG